MAISQADLEQHVTDIIKGGQSYSRTGINFVRADLEKVWNILQKLQKQTLRAGTRGVSFLSDFSGASGTTEADEWGDA